MAVWTGEGDVQPGKGTFNDFVTLIPIIHSVFEIDSKITNW